MAFKMNKPVWHGTAGHKKALSSIKLNRSMDNSSMPDGRPKSSAFQKRTDEKDITWDEEKLVSERKEDKEGGGTKTTKDYETEGTSQKKVEKKAETPEEIAAYKKYLKDVKEGKVKRNTKYDKKKHKKTRQEVSETDPEKPKEEIIKIPKKDPKPIPVKTKTPKLKTVEVPEETPKKKKRRKKKYQFGDITKKVVKYVGDKVDDAGKAISRRRHMNKKSRRSNKIRCAAYD
jgi:hypothetical protein